MHTVQALLPALMLAKTVSCLPQGPRNGPTLPLGEEVFWADADVRRDYNLLDPSDILTEACVSMDTDTPAYRLRYLRHSTAAATATLDATTVATTADATLICVWRPWRLGTFIVVDDCQCIV